MLCQPLRRIGVALRIRLSLPAPLRVHVQRGIDLRRFRSSDTIRKISNVLEDSKWSRRSAQHVHHAQQSASLAASPANSCLRSNALPPGVSEISSAGTAAGEKQQRVHLRHGAVDPPGAHLPPMQNEFLCHRSSALCCHFCLVVISVYTERTVLSAACQAFLGLPLRASMAPSTNGLYS